MTHYSFADQFRALHDQAVARFREGHRDADTLLGAADVAWLAANGISPQHLYDYAEDHVGGGEPGPERALAIELVRRDYFLNVQGGRPSPVRLEEAELPARDATVGGIAWLPRLLPKARAKLRGELAPSLMYCCGGDRNFFRTHDIHPAEFLTLLWRAGDDDAAIVAWVRARSAARLR